MAEPRIDILDYDGEGYKPVIRFGAWRVAYINYAERFDQKNFCRMERHNLTDETFVLLSGSATLVVGEEKKLYPMTAGKCYNILKGEWHHIFVEPGAQVLVIENDDTSVENSDYIDVK